MTKTMTAIALVFGLGLAASPAQAAAQEAAQAAAPKPKVSCAAVKQIQALQAAVQANNGAEVKAKLAEANAVAKSADDRYMIGALEYKYATTAKDDSMRAQAIEQMIASGFEGAPLADLYGDLGATYARMNEDQRALDAYQHALQLDPTNIDATAGIAEAKVAQGKVAEALALLEKGIAVQSTGGGRAPEAWYKRAVAVAYKAKLPAAMELSRKWIVAYPTTDAWQNSLAIYQNLGQLSETEELDVLRLKRAVGALTASDYFNYGDIAVRKGYSGEAKAVLEEGFAANAIKRSDPSFSQLYGVATQKTKGDRENIPAAPDAGASASVLINMGDAWYGYGEYAKAAEFYRAALAKPGVDKDLANLHLGMALARQGDKAGALAALNAVGGDEAQTAKYWLVYANTEA